MRILTLIIARILYALYGYEALNLCFRVFPSGAIVIILRSYGADIGEGVRIQPPFVVHNADQDRPIFKNLKIGNHCYIGRYCIFDLQDQITVEDACTISHRVILNTHTHAGKSPLGSSILPASQGSIKIQEGAYLGLNITVLQGVTIGKESLIGANALVNKSIPPYSIAYGVPCKPKSSISK